MSPNVWNVANLSLESFPSEHTFLPLEGRIYEWSYGAPSSDVSESIGGRILAFSPGARKVLRVGNNGVRVFDRGTRVLETLSSDVSDIENAQYSPDGSKIALARTRWVEIYEAKNGQLIAKLFVWHQTKSKGGVDWLALYPDGKMKGTEAARRLVVAVP